MEEQLKDVILLVLCNKQDQPGAATPEEIGSLLNLERFDNVKNVFPTVATSDDPATTGLDTAFDWLTEELEKRQ